ncbi:MAG: NAD(P)/FAD-dependent oxidoreductase [Dyella sp.]|nr:NAD(P)/FAD-dependent oxidoreductase [Dyella sp.]
MSETDLSYKRALARGDLAQSFDTIVIGSGAGGLTTAALLALDGQRVLVLERHAVLGGCLQAYHRNGFEWDVGLHYIGEVQRKNSGLARLFATLSRGQLEWAPMPEVYNRIVLAERTYDCVAGTEAFKDRLKSYFPNEARAIDQYVGLVVQANRAAKGFFSERALPPTPAEAASTPAQTAFAPFSQRTVLEVMDGLTDNAELKAVWCGHYGDYCNSPAEASFAIHAMVVGHYLEGASYPVGGAPRIALTLADTVRAAGGHCLVAADVASLVVENERAVGVRMADGTIVEARQVVSAIGIQQTLPLLKGNETPATQALAAASSTLGTTQCYAVLNIGLNAANGELGIHAGNVWVHPTNDLPGNLRRYLADPARELMPLYFMTHPSLRDPSWPERYPGRSTMDVCGLTDWSVFSRFAGTEWMRRGAEYDDMKARLSEHLLEQAYARFPQIRGRVVHAELSSPLSYNHFLGRSQGNFMGYEQTPKRFAQRWMRAHSPVKGLYFSGQDVSAAGVSGAMVGGLVAASAVLGRNLFLELQPRA